MAWLPVPERESSNGACRDQSGAVLVLVALLMTVLLGVLAIAVDVGYTYMQRSQAQTAADSGALAAAQNLPDDPAGAQATGMDYISNNLIGGTGVITPGFGGDPNKVEARAGLRIRTFFARVFGRDFVNVGARAVAEVRGGGGQLAIFNNSANISEADSLKMNGDKNTVQGGIHSNGGIYINGSNFTAASATYSGDTKPVLSGSSMNFGGGRSEPARDWNVEPWPAKFKVSDFTPTYRAAEFLFTQEGQTIPPGVYYATKRFSVNGKQQKGNITVIAPVIEINGEMQRFTPYQKGVLFFSTGTQETVLDGRGYNWQGIIFQPNGRVKINGDASSVYQGLIEAQTVLVNGQGLKIIGAAGVKSPTVISLIE